MTDQQPVTPVDDVAGPCLALRPKDAARALAIGERKLWELTNRGDIPCFRIGRAVRYDPVDLRNWITAQKQRRAKQ